MCCRGDRPYYSNFTVSLFYLLTGDVPYTGETLMDKLGIDWKAKKAEFVAYLEEVKNGNQENLYDPRRMITSGPGYIPIAKRT